jgi:hypothetical protein
MGLSAIFIPHEAVPRIADMLAQRGLTIRTDSTHGEAGSYDGCAIECQAPDGPIVLIRLQEAPTYSPHHVVAVVEIRNPTLHWLRQHRVLAVVKECLFASGGVGLQQLRRGSGHCES